MMDVGRDERDYFFDFSEHKRLDLFVYFCIF